MSREKELRETIALMTNRLRHLECLEPGGGVPAGLIAIFDVACPADWTRVAAFDNLFLRGAAVYGGTGGTATHTHTGPSHTHPQNMGDATSTTGSAKNVFAGGATNQDMNASDVGGAAYTRVRTGVSAGGTGATGPAGTLPPYIDVIFCKKN